MRERTILSYGVEILLYAAVAMAFMLAAGCRPQPEWPDELTPLTTEEFEAFQQQLRDEIDNRKLPAHSTQADTGASPVDPQTNRAIGVSPAPASDCSNCPLFPDAPPDTASTVKASSAPCSGGSCSARPVRRFFRRFR